MTLKRGTQIAYIPTHANGDIEHPDVELGFVTSVRDDVAFCRYWSKYSPDELRTKANSEATPIDMVVEHVSVHPLVVESALQVIDDWEQCAGSKY